ncbi:MAG: lipoyl synthase [Gammaproteobacteria bacterium]|nr:lipoyl synthase [Gammaproteobacteria bacterium]MCY4219231.1 lipoyl synthase [Gammaproteobacteria bacterium]MCY4274237.1 lipoyl synthase [Gammaproteobacteria bacterium]
MTEPIQSERPRPRPIVQGEKLRGAAKMDRIPVKFKPLPRDQLLRKPKWIRASFTGTTAVASLKRKLREGGLHTVCEEAACPNLGECFGNGTATFMIMGDICTRRCPFCDVAHGRPNPLNPDEPDTLARTVQRMELKYVVITSVDRDDLKDGGAKHFTDCIRAVREQSPSTQIEVLVPDFRGRMDIALHILEEAPPDIFNHNLETVPRLYKQARPGSDYQFSLSLLKRAKVQWPTMPTKSGLMLGLGETREEVIQVMHDMRDHNIDMITIGQYLQPSRHHLPVLKYWTPEEFDELGKFASQLGFASVASGPMVRSSYHADLQAHESANGPIDTN